MKTLTLFNRLKKLPGGTRLFTLGVCKTAPYFASIAPQVEELQPGYARVTLRKHRRVENHLRTVHAIAMCNMAELAGGLMTDVSIPDKARWIPVGMTVSYRKKAGSDLTAVARGDGIDWRSQGNIVVPVEIRDRDDAVVFTAEITMNLKQPA
ncbi:acyl-coenzyme A thioesterase PaaI-like protein [Fluviicoccus keumensis]|uniref:Acyl-coenzyme A thioesterase PaaI-like protein n=1 Tax=Fluviicoccus keumensis TaxID=1435465 RepID=A0A4Q7YMZ4_9GAMM|nr:acyl-coenzyme A thioesterase PaaI-like protein [Fluviicoccus keumensis]